MSMAGIAPPPTATWKRWPGHPAVARPPRCTVGACEATPARWTVCRCGRVFAACGGEHHRHDVVAERAAHAASCPAMRAPDPELERAAAAANESRAAIGGQGFTRRRWCDACQAHHPPTFRWRARERPWHATPDSELTPSMRAARDEAR